MQTISRFFLIIGIIFIGLGIIPWFVSHPTSSAVNMEPNGLWETIVVTAYDTQVLFLILGILLVIGELYLAYKRKQLF